MNREQFMRELVQCLNNVDADERQDILHDFEEHFDAGKENGRSEEDIAAKLGSPAQIAKELTAVYYLERAESHTSAGNVLRAVWAALSLGFYNVAIVLGPFIALISLLFSGWTIGLSFIVTPLFVVINLVMYPQSFHLFDLFVSIGLTGLGLLISIAMLYASRKVCQGFVKYIRFNAKLVKGGLKYD